MTQEELQKIIDVLDNGTIRDRATFGIFKYGGDSDESFIKADKEGLKLYALELLRAAIKSSEVISDKERSIIPIPFEEKWIDEQSETVIQYIEPVAERVQISEPFVHQDTFFEKMLPIGCYAILILLLVALLVGLWTLATLIF